MTFETTAEVIRIDPVQQITDKFKKQSILLLCNANSNYPDNIEVEIHNQSQPCPPLGATIRCKIRVSGRLSPKYNRPFISLKLESYQQIGQPQPAANASGYPPEYNAPATDDIPF